MTAHHISLGSEDNAV